MRVHKTAVRQDGGLKHYRIENTGQQLLFETGQSQDLSIFCHTAMHTEQLSLVRWEQHLACSIQTDSRVVLFWKGMARDYPDIKGADRIIINMSV